MSLNAQVLIRTCSLLVIVLHSIGAQAFEIIHSKGESSSAPKAINIALGHSGYPLMDGAGEKSRGVLPDILRSLLRPLGFVDVRIGTMPYYRLSKALASGEVDAIGLSDTDLKFFMNQNSGLSCIQAPIFHFTPGVYSHTDMVVINPRIGHMLPSSPGALDSIVQLLGAAEYSEHYLKTSGSLFKSLATGRIDYAISSGLFARYWSHRLDTEFHAVQNLGSIGLHLCLSEVKFGRDEVEQLAMSITELLPSVNVDDIMSAHGVPPILDKPFSFLYNAQVPWQAKKTPYTMDRRKSFTFTRQY